jgi:hypothetical protein
LTASANISAAVLSLYGTLKSDGLSATPDTNVCSSAPASNTVLVAGDFDSLGATAFATAIAYAAWSTAGFNDFTLNASGVANISLTGVSKFGARNFNYDAINNAPPWVSLGLSRTQFATADSANDPKLVVTYTLSDTSFLSQISQPSSHHFPTIVSV